MINIHKVEDFEDIKKYLDPHLIDKISDDHFSGVVDFSPFNSWYKFKKDKNIIGLFMVRPINSVTVEIHPLFKRRHAKHAKDLGLRIMEKLKVEGITSFICEFPDNNTATVKLAESCGFNKVGIKKSSWLKNGELIDILIYQKV